MSEIATAKKRQELLEVDRLTIYWLADARTLPAIEVRNKWLFPAEQVKDWFELQIVTNSLANARPPSREKMANMISSPAKSTSRSFCH